MRHLKKKLKFSRPAKEARRALRNLIANLILYERIETTEAKAKKARQFLDRLINKGKEGNLSAYRYLLRFFYLKEPAKKIMEELAKRYPQRTSGYSRIIPLKIRKGDGAKIVIWELVEPDKKEKKKTKKASKKATKTKAKTTSKASVRKAKTKTQASRCQKENRQEN